MEAFYDVVKTDDANGLVGYDKITWLKDALLHRTKLTEKPHDRNKPLDFISSSKNMD